jgi:hypothetical protein
MSAVDLMLPRHLYMENRDQQGDVTDVVYLHDRLMNWFDSGKGVNRLCQSVYEQQLARIAHWEESQVLLLEEQWLAIENGEDDDANEAQYHIACDAVAREADDRRALAARERDLRHSAINELVENCAGHLEEHAPEPFTSHAAEFTLAIMLTGIVAFMLF